MVDGVDEEHLIFKLSDDASDFIMALVADNDDAEAFLFHASDDTVDLFDHGAGGVNDLITCLFRFF